QSAASPVAESHPAGQDRSLRGQAHGRPARLGLARARGAGDAGDASGLEVEGDIAQDGLLGLLRDHGQTEVSDGNGAHEVCSPTSCAVWGSRVSRRLSPMKLNAMTIVRMHRPGKNAIHQAANWDTPSLTMAPQSGVGGTTPRERKDRPAMVRMAEPTSRVA